ncbi:DUF2848 family protein [Actinosynnema sp. NPDC047251]|uniref:DUF2848 domain-containing protein n=1 Tax=Saccharothrix espanaensis (strain ATCC 51144 / DSM 44229 / JCM 9112 / NBRC 15066 / NRRL 15764) TaxID=1179773 RepID=K0K5E4_SACES|nr:DUF2848 family protein [Saccharothrix espanaensis]CCH32812.1 hypothetical protein BN6_55530 [Saccharothrix espanaensis DSM 44229]
MGVTLHVAGTGEELALTPSRLVVAGYTARDTASVRAHIAELAAIGVPPPASVPAFYDLDPVLVTTDAVVEVDGPATSGEVEPVVIRIGGRYFLGVGSDHTDRDLERADVAASKAACPKPLGAQVVEVDLGSVGWDDHVAESSVDGWQYQRGRVAVLRHPADLIDRMTRVLGPVTGDLVLFCGTLPLLAGEFAYGPYWRVHLEVPGGPLLTHAYEIKQKSA